ncbi:MAG: hypothetical protein IJM90_05165 [Firmicutes bacterium]|nr:hypothetical protein [Bacillota bacterium]
MDKLYKDLDIVKKYQLQKADMGVGKSSRLSKSQQYLEDTASDFEKIEKDILSQLT